MNENINLAEWYNAAEAAARLTANSGKKIDSSYVRQLARYKRVRTLKLGERASLYFKEDIDAYIVEDRGEKSGRAKRQKAKPKKQKHAA